MKDPASLDDNDPAIKAANTLFFEYIKQSDILAKGNLESEVRNTISKTMFYVDAGFHNPKYLSEIHSLLMESV
jgi:hypothetical protein